MKTYARMGAIFAVSVLLAACGARQTGVLHNTLTTNVKPAITITAHAPFAVVDAGRVWTVPKTDVTPGMADTSFDYAVYASPAAPVSSAFAYAGIIRLDAGDMWEFVPKGNRIQGSFGARKKVEPVNRDGAVYTLRVPAEGDWASALLAENGHAIPEAWIAKRWMFSLDSASRAVAEYREPWPAGLDVPESDIMLLRESHAVFLQEFEKRAFAVFSFDTSIGDFSETAPRVSTWKRSPVQPNVERLAGDVIQVDRSMGDGPFL